jgi:hypothetical protein
MENSISIKKVLRRIYNIDYSKATLNDDDEFVIHSNGVSELTQFLRKNDIDNGIIVTPSGYRSGLFMSYDNDGELYSSSKLTPETVSFSLNLFGMKKGFFYRIVVTARNLDNIDLITDDRSITVSDDSQQIVISSDLSDVYENKNLTGYFRALSNEANLFLSFGKICIKDIVIDEVVLQEEDNLNQAEDDVSEEVPENKRTLVTYGVFDLHPNLVETYKGRYVELTRLFGRGINMFYDKNETRYVLERSNSESVLTDPFTNLNYEIDMNFAKVPGCGIFDSWKTDEVSSDISPNTLKQGFVAFALTKDGEKVYYTGSNGRLYIFIYRID